MRDVCAIAGAVTLSTGFGLAWLPLGFIVAGGLLLGISVWGFLRDPGKTPGPA
ncbi:MAG TPA: hypothetical protein VEA69_21150 [Tepidisphaeraceae bacterium]|nr:hypothetical protein [Tepidisphaeraceae bacterium]